MSSRPRFGQGSPVNVYVPRAVEAGNPFLLKAVRFDPKKPVKIEIAALSRRFFGAEGKPIDERIATTDSSGNISITIERLDPGKYTVTVTGQSNGEEVAAEALLDVE